MASGSKNTPGALTKALAEVLTAMMEDDPRSQQQVGAAAGISQSQLSKYLRGARVMSVDEADTLCRVLGIDLAVAVRAAGNLPEFRKKRFGT